MKISNEVMEGFLNCKTKGQLKLAGESGTLSDYEAMTSQARRSSLEATLARLAARLGEGDACRGVQVTPETLKRGAPILVDATLEDENLSIRFDALKRADGPSKLGGHHYLPVLHAHGDKVGREQKLLLAVLGFVLARVQGLRPATGLVARGSERGLGKVRLDAKLYRQAGQVALALSSRSPRPAASTATIRDRSPWHRRRLSLFLSVVLRPGRMPPLTSQSDRQYGPARQSACPTSSRRTTPSR